MRKILAIAAAAALTAGVSAFAANPFSDVSTDDWAFQAISDLSDQGVVEGYPDGTFKGERNITRYELAQIIARLMAKEDQLNAEQRATLDKLAGEYADELANLGVRVSNLEKKVGNIYWSGDARMRYQSMDNSYKDGKEAGESWNGRMRINVKAQVNEDTTFNGRLDYNMDFKNNDSNNPSSDTDKNNGVYMEVLNAKHKFGDFTATIGRYGNSFGNQGSWFFGNAHGFDGGELAYSHNKLSLATGFGQFDTNYSKDGNDTKRDINDKDAYYARGSYDFDYAKLGLTYLKFQEGNTMDDELYGVDLNVPFGGYRRWSFQGEYVKNSTTTDSNDDAWNLGLQYSSLNLKKPGTFSLGVWYNDIGSATYFGGTGLQTDILDYNKTLGEDKKNRAWYKDDNEMTFWNVIGEVTLQQNVFLHAEYAFAPDLDKGEDPDDTWTVSLNYKF